MRRTEIRVLHGGWAAVALAVFAVGCAAEVAELAVRAPDGRSVARLSTKDSMVEAEGGILRIEGADGRARVVLYNDDSASRVRFAHLAWTADSRVVMGVVVVGGRPSMEFAFARDGARVVLDDGLRGVLARSIVARYGQAGAWLDALTWASTEEAARLYGRGR